MQFSGDMFVLYMIKNQKKLLTNVKEVLFPSGEQIYIQEEEEEEHGEEAQMVKFICLLLSFFPLKGCIK